MECLRKAYKFVCCISDPKFPVPYEFAFGKDEDIAHNREIFESNFVRTSKYRWYDFLPSTFSLIQSHCCFSSTASPTFTSS